MSRSGLLMPAQAIRIVSILGAIVAAYSIGHEVGRPSRTGGQNWPNLYGCKLEIVGRYASDDKVDMATLLRRDCDLGEHITYFLRMDIAARDPMRSGWWSAFELQNDVYPKRHPTVEWTGIHTVQVTVSTRTLQGRVISNAGYDIEIVRIYEPREPGAFPNLGP